MDRIPISAVIKFEDGSEEEFPAGSFFLLAHNRQPPMYEVMIRSSIRFDSEEEMLAFNQGALIALNDMLQFFENKRRGNEGFAFSNN